MQLVERLVKRSKYYRELMGLALRAAAALHEAQDIIRKLEHRNRCDQEFAGFLVRTLVEKRKAEMAAKEGNRERKAKRQ